MIDRQPRITDLVPHRYGILALLFFTGLAVVAALEAGYLWLPQLSAMAADGQFAALDLESEGGLANWFSSMSLALASVMAAVIYSVRRHRQDDYHGRYRVWLWASALWMLMSIDEAASVHEGLTQLALHLSGQRGFGNGSIWWVAAYGLIFAALGTRLLLEMRCCRLSSTALIGAVVCFVAAVVAKLDLLPMLRGAYAVMAEEGCEMVGDVLVLLSMSVHARYTILDAQGALGTKAKKPAKTTASASRKEASSKPATESPAKRSWFKRNEVDAAHTSPPAPTAKTLENSKSGKASKAVRSSAPSDNESDARDGATRTARRQHSNDAEDDYDYEVDRRLSKAERKALRRQKDRQHHGDES